MKNLQVEQVSELEGEIIKWKVRMEKIEKELNKFKTIAIYGAIGTGKTSLAYSLIDKLKKHKEN